MDDENLAWEVRDRTLAYSCAGFDIVHERVRVPSGDETSFDFLSEPPSVVVIPFTPDGDVVIIREWREAVRRVNRGFPAGTVEPTDEDLAAAARRELTEETGYVADTVEQLGTFEPANGVADTVHHYFVARGCTADTEQQLQADETIAVDTTTMEDLTADVLDDALRDGRTALGVLHYQLTRAG